MNAVLTHFCIREVKWKSIFFGLPECSCRVFAIFICSVASLIQVLMPVMLRLLQRSGSSKKSCLPAISASCILHTGVQLFVRRNNTTIVTEGNKKLYILTLIFPLIPSYFLISPTCSSKILNFPPIFTKIN